MWEMHAQVGAQGEKNKGQETDALAMERAPTKCLTLKFSSLNLCESTTHDKREGERDTQTHTQTQTDVPSPTTQTAQ